MKLQAAAASALLLSGAHANSIPSDLASATASATLCNIDLSTFRGDVNAPEFRNCPDLWSLHPPNPFFTSSATHVNSQTPTLRTVIRRDTVIDSKPTLVNIMVARDPSPLPHIPTKVIKDFLMSKLDEIAKGVDRACDECARAHYDCGCDNQWAQSPGTAAESALLQRLEAARDQVLGWCKVCDEQKIDCGCWSKPTCDGPACDWFNRV